MKTFHVTIFHVNHESRHTKSVLNTCRAQIYTRNMYDTNTRPDLK